MKQMIFIISSHNFPVSPLGLIHIRQRIKVHEPLGVVLNEKIDLQTSLSRVERAEKGVEIDISCRVFLNGRDVCIWEGVSTLLSRNKRTLAQLGKKTTVRDVIKPNNGVCVCVCVCVCVSA